MVRACATPERTEVKQELKITLPYGSTDPRTMRGCACATSSSVRPGTAGQRSSRVASTMTGHRRRWDGRHAARDSRV
ncbi:hypothetical protein C8Q80DRAFT_785951 [Daedaleopsis nitida]|nr:hypothetical protein C8Q80DRAFT_785951 [Daedaleopsis nitida]